MQQSCSHSNAICNQRFKNRIELRTQEQPLVAKHRGGTRTTAAATAAHRRYLSSPAAATLHGKAQGFVLRLPPQNKAHATSMQPLQCDLQPEIQETHRTTHTALRTTSPLPIVTASLPHHFPSTPLPFVTTSLPHHSPSSPLPFLTTPLHHHFPSSPLPFLTTSRRHHLPSSPPPFLTTPLHHHSLHHHFHRHHFPSLPLPIVTTSLRHHPVS